MKKRTIIALAAALLLPATSFALTGTEIAQKAYDVEDGTTRHTAVQMDLIDKDGSVDARLIEEWGKDDENDLTSVVMVFRSPASVRDTRFLQIENKGRDDDKWIYLPALKRVRRIASSEGDKSFMGSDATYDDMDTREVEQDTHDLIKEESVGQWNCYVLKDTPVDPSDSQYSYRISWIDKQSFVPVKMEMYDKQGELVKVLTVEKLEQVQGYWTPLQNLLKNVQTGHSTRLTIKKIVFDESQPDALYTTNFLQTGRVR
jgi:hypothetical protein